MSEFSPYWTHDRTTVPEDHCVADGWNDNEGGDDIDPQPGPVDDQREEV